MQKIYTDMECVNILLFVCDIGASVAAEGDISSYYESTSSVGVGLVGRDCQGQWRYQYRALLLENLPNPRSEQLSCGAAHIQVASCLWRCTTQQGW